MTETTNGGSMNERAIISVRNLVKYFPIETGFLRRQVGLVKAVDDCELRPERGRNACPCWRERLRQDDNQPLHNPGAAAHRGSGPVSHRRRGSDGSHADGEGGVKGCATQHPHDLSGPILFAEPPHEPTPDYR